MPEPRVTPAQSSFPALAGHEYMRLTTFRKSGEPVPTPVWFAQVEGRLYVMTDPDSGKVKRIRNNAQVEVTPCDSRGNPLGDQAEGMARILDAEEGKAADAALSRKYGWKKRVFGLMGSVRRRPTVHLEITPM
jgi:PPOX class probable F420-dependent enzyme